MIVYLIKGILTGVLVALPVGPIGIFCLRRMLIQSPLVGLASGLGSATADTIYATLALLGLSFVSSWILAHSILVRIISSLFLCTLGTKILFSKPPRPQATWSTSLIQSYFSTLFLTLSNPLLIVSFTATFTILRADYSLNTSILSFLSLGVFLGSSLWWIVLSGITSYANLSLSPERLAIINKISGSLIILFGMVTLLSILFK